ncbi:hypothetical protein Tco_0159729, partial [Tanacetum coccineum]
GDSEISGNGGGGGKARSLSTSSSDGKGIATDSSVSNGYVSSEEGTWSTTGATTELAGARCSSSSEASSSLSLSKESSSSSSPPLAG